MCSLDRIYLFRIGNFNGIVIVKDLNSSLEGYRD